jgi:hypothetical protein
LSYVLPLLKKAFAWARSANPSQPLTSGIWAGDWSDSSKIKPIEQLQLSESDVITFHNYDGPEEFEKRITIFAALWQAANYVPNTWQGQMAALSKAFYRLPKNTTWACITGVL